MGRVHTGKPTRGRGSFSEDGGRIGDRDLSMITMLARRRISNLMLGKLQKKVKKQQGRKGAQQEKRGEGRRGKRRTRKERKGKERGRETRAGRTKTKQERGDTGQEQHSPLTWHQEVEFAIHGFSQSCTKAVTQQIFWKTTRPRHIK